MHYKKWEVDPWGENKEKKINPEFKMNNGSMHNDCCLEGHLQYLELSC